MRTIRVLLAVAMVVMFIHVNGQNQRNIWYFGLNAGLDFSLGPPVPLLNGQLQAHEGCSSICDSAGNLLFYTNGGPFVTYNYTGGVWNRNHLLMPNGNLDTVNSCNSASQSALIVPDPRNQYKYYIFTTDCQENSMAGGLRYHTVDMTLDNGFGDVVEKNILLLPGVTESVIGIMHSNGSDYWVVVSKLGNNSYYAFQITANGIQPPVISSIGNSTPQQVGQMCVSPDGDKVGFAATWDTYLLDFDKSTGILSNFMALGVESYGCAFSASGDVFYASKLSNPRNMYQFDMNAVDIASTVVSVGNSASLTGNLQLGNDGKIYCARQGNLIGVINDPEVLGVGCNFAPTGLSLGGQVSSLGLPNYVNQFIDNWCDSYDTLTITSSAPYTGPSGNHQWSNSGVYVDTISNANSCDSIITINLTINGSTSAIETEDNSGISIYPNPFTNVFSIDLGFSHQLNSIDIIDPLGKIIERIHVNEGHRIYNISMLARPLGIFLIKVNSPDKVYYTRIVQN